MRAILIALESAPITTILPNLLHCKASQSALDVHEKGFTMVKHVWSKKRAEECRELVEGRLRELLISCGRRDRWEELETGGFDILKSRGRFRYDLQVADLLEKFPELCDPLSPIWKVAHDVMTSAHPNPRKVKLLHWGVMVSLPQSQDQPFHCDGFHRTDLLHAPVHALNIFLPLINIDKRSIGPTEFEEKSHLLWRGLLRSKEPFGGTAKLAAPLLDAGDLLAFDYRLFHRGLGNKTNDVIRPVVYLTFGIEGDGWEDILNFSSQRYLPFAISSKRNENIEDKNSVIRDITNQKSTSDDDDETLGKGKSKRRRVLPSPSRSKKVILKDNLSSSLDVETSEPELPLSSEVLSSSSSSSLLSTLGERSASVCVVISREEAHKRAIEEEKQFKKSIDATLETYDVDNPQGMTAKNKSEGGLVVGIRPRTFSSALPTCQLHEVADGDTKIMSPVSIKKCQGRLPSRLLPATPASNSPGKNTASPLSSKEKNSVTPSRHRMLTPKVSSSQTIKPKDTFPSEIANVSGSASTKNVVNMDNTEYPFDMDLTHLPYSPEKSSSNRRGRKKESFKVTPCWATYSLMASKFVRERFNQERLALPKISNTATKLLAVRMALYFALILPEDHIYLSDFSFFTKEAEDDQGALKETYSNARAQEVCMTVKEILLLIQNLYNENLNDNKVNNETAEDVVNKNTLITKREANTDSKSLTDSAQKKKRGPRKKSTETANSGIDQDSYRIINSVNNVTTIAKTQLLSKQEPIFDRRTEINIASISNPSASNTDFISMPSVPLFDSSSNENNSFSVPNSIHTNVKGAIGEVDEFFVGNHGSSTFESKVMRKAEFEDSPIFTIQTQGFKSADYDQTHLIDSDSFPYSCSESLVEVSQSETNPNRYYHEAETVTNRPNPIHNEDDLDDLNLVCEHEPMMPF